MKEPIVILFNLLDDPAQKEEQTRDITLIEEALQDEYSVTRIAVGEDVSGLMSQFKEILPKYVFNLCEEVDNDSWGEIYIAGIMELLKIPYTGSGPFCLSLALDKARTKDVLLNQGIAVPKYQVVDSDKITLREDLRFPLIIKPLCEDGSFGIELDSVVYNKDQFYERLPVKQKEFNCSVIVEEYIKGRELNISILENGEGPQALPISELDYATMPEGLPRICSYKGKWDKESIDYKGTVPVCPVEISRDLKEKLETTAFTAYRIMGCRDYARVDVRLTEEEVPYVIDVNPNPCISPDSGFVRSAKVVGLDYKRLINTIMKSCQKRNQNGDRGEDPSIKEGGQRNSCKFVREN